MQLEFEIWLDNQLPSVIAKWMQEEFGYHVKSAFILEIQTSTDKEIFERARQHPFVIIISKDGDFQKLIEIHGSPPKLIKLNTGNLPNKMLWTILKPVLPGAVNLLLQTNAEIVFIENKSSD